MEAKEVKVYEEKEPKGERFYKFYKDVIEKLDLSVFLDSVVDFEEGENLNNRIYGILQGKMIREYRVVLTFLNSTNHKNYMVYTNDQKDSDNHLIVYGVVYEPDALEPFIGFPTTQDEWASIYSVMDAVFLCYH